MIITGIDIVKNKCVAIIIDSKGNILVLRNLSRFRLFQVDTITDLKRKTISLLN